MEIGRSELIRLTAGKGVANTALRWLPFFLPTLAVAFRSSTPTLAVLLGLAEASGLATLFAGRWLDSGRERLVIIVSLVAVSVGSLVALQGSVWAFAVMAVLLGVASGYVTVGGHAWISARVPFDRRARFIGVFEISWASALLIGAPLVAILISLFGWRGPFVAVAVAALVAGFGVWTIDDGEQSHSEEPKLVKKVPLTLDAWIIVVIAATVAITGLSTIVVAGTWLDEVLGVSTGGVGLVAMSFGLAELTASSSSAAFADRLGKRRTVQGAALATMVGLAVIAVTGTSLLIGALGLLIFFVGFEYSIVTSFSLVSEAMPEARGRTIGISSAISTLARGIGVAIAGFLYESFGIHGPVVLSSAAIAVAFLLLAVIARRRPELA